MLSEQDLKILAFERGWYRYQGAKEQAVRDTFDMSATRYYQHLNRILDEPEALKAHPMLVSRLRRLREQRSGARRRRVG